MKVFNLFIAIGLISGTASASAANFSFIGNLNHDDAVQEFNFEVEGAAREVTLRTWSFAGGTNTEGQVIQAGGFDPVVSLFNSSTGALISFNDDGYSFSPGGYSFNDGGYSFNPGGYNPGGFHFQVPATEDEFQIFPIFPITPIFPSSSFAYDSLLATNLSAGNYTVTVTQFKSFPVGSSLTNGFSGSDSENFASRTSHWALDVSNVENATVGATYISQVPEPDSFAMLLAGLGLLGFMAKRKKR